MATCTWVGVDAITSPPGYVTDLPLIAAHTLATWSGVPFWMMNSRSSGANAARSVVEEITPAMISAGVGAGFTDAWNPSGGFRLAVATVTTASDRKSTRLNSS